MVANDNENGGQDDKELSNLQKQVAKEIKQKGYEQDLDRGRRGRPGRPGRPSRHTTNRFEYEEKCMEKSCI